MSVDVSYDARTGDAVEEVEISSADQVSTALEAAAAAAPRVAASTPWERRGWLYAIAAALTEPATVESLVAVADRETALGEERLRGELDRSAGQLRFYGDVAAEGSYLGATIDHAAPQAPDLRRMRVPLGPVAVLGASNFPFAFGTLGNDTGSALAAGCPVVAKAHPAHPATSRMLSAVAAEALAAAAAPAGVLAVVAGLETGQQLVTAPQTTAVAFTGSQRGGLALWRMANEREVVIPVFAEMGTTNPVVMTRSAVARAEEIACAFIGSLALGMGQFCTKPGLLLVPDGHGIPQVVGDALTAAAPTGWLLTEPIAAAYAAGLEELKSAGAEVLAEVPGVATGWAAGATVLSVKAGDLQPGSRLVEECFGPVALVAEYGGEDDLRDILAGLQGALAASVMSSGPLDPGTPGLVSLLAPMVGRVAVDEWPTGVAYTWAQQHGGPWPATTAPAATSVGAAALDRFTRPVTWQSVPDIALPPALQEANPWQLPRRVDGLRA